MVAGRRRAEPRQTLGVMLRHERIAAAMRCRIVHREDNGTGSRETLGEGGGEVVALLLDVKNIGLERLNAAADAPKRQKTSRRADTSGDAPVERCPRDLGMAGAEDETLALGGKIGRLVDQKHVRVRAQRRGKPG